MKDVHNTDPSQMMNSLNQTALSMSDSSPPSGSIIVGGKSGTNQEIIFPSNAKSFISDKFGSSNGSFQIVNVNGDTTPTVQIITALDRPDGESMTIDEDGRIIGESGQPLEVSTEQMN